MSNSVWILRGWSQPQDKAERQRRLYYNSKASQSFELTRADANPIPTWKEVQYKQDGKHRLGYNPAVETREISQEEFEAVRASEKTYKETDNWTQFNRKGGDRAALAKL